MAIESGLQFTKFAYLFEAAFGLNLAYTLIEQIHDAGQKNFIETKSCEFAKCRSLANEPRPNGECNQDADNALAASMNKTIDDSEIAWNKREQRYKNRALWWINIAIHFAAFNALFLLICLGIMGFYPQAMVPQWCMIALVLIVFVPVLGVLLGLRIFWWNKKKKIKKGLRQQFGALQTLADIRHNL